jgi:SET domain-containing protein
MAVTRRKKARKSATAPSRRPRKVPDKPRLGPVNEWFELRRSGIQGVGAFAIQDIPKGTRLIEYTGEKITNAEADRRYDDTKMKRHHTFLFVLNQKQVVDAQYGGNESMYINHSCDPNAETFIIRGRIWIESMRTIRAGEEITYDYQYDMDAAYTDDDLFRFYGCRCGAPNCRRTIVKTRRRPKA